MYYGNATAPAGTNPQAVWGNSFRVVQHLNDDLLDSSAYNNDGVNSGSTSAPGQVAEGQLFDGVDDFIDLGSDASIDDIFAGGGTVSAWINPDSWGGNNYGRIFDKAGATLPGAGWALELAAGTQSLLFQQGFSGGVGSWQSATGSISLSTWQHVAVTYDSSSAANVPTFYINGIEVGRSVDATPGGIALSDAGLDLHVGNYSLDTIRAFDGVIDDVRISAAVHSADWTRAQFLNTDNTFVSFGSEETAPAISGVVGNDSDVDGDSLTVSLVDAPTNAAAFTLNKDGTFSYTPTANFNGIVSFTYTVNDGTEDSNVSTVTITVNPVNDAPTVTATAADTGTEDTDVVYTHAQMLALIGAADVDDADANLSIAISNIANGTLVMSGGSGGRVPPLPLRRRTTSSAT